MPSNRDATAEPTAARRSTVVNSRTTCHAATHALPAPPRTATKTPAGSSACALAPLLGRRCALLLPTWPSPHKETSAAPYGTLPTCLTESPKITRRFALLACRRRACNVFGTHAPQPCHPRNPPFLRQRTEPRTLLLRGKGWGCSSYYIISPRRALEHMSLHGIYRDTPTGHHTKPSTAGWVTDIQSNCKRQQS